MPPAIRTRDLEKDYGSVRALEGLDLTVPEGSFFGLLGPNGAGKTTFINVLVGLVRKTGGEAAVFGHDVEDDYRRARDAIGLAPQEFNVDRFFPIREVLQHKAGYHGVPDAEAERRADEVLKRVGIYDKRDTRFDWLSGGMKRRFVLARALVTDPDLLILDEPTAGVDVELRRELWDLITDLNEDGTTVLLTTHYIEEAERLCDEVAILDEGRKVAVETPAELTREGVDTLTLSLAAPPSTAPAIDDERVEDVAVEGDRLVVRTADGSGLAPEAVRQLDAQGYRVVNVDVSRTSLEEVFVSMTRGDDEDAAGGGDGARSRGANDAADGDVADSGAGDSDADDGMTGEDDDGATEAGGIRS